MDDSFKKAAENLNFSYKADFWNEVESKLADDSLDAAFKLAAAKINFVPQFDIHENLNDAFLDEAFKSAEPNFNAEYKSEYWQQFQTNLNLIQQDEAFLTASNATVVDYQPHYWSEADIALQSDGLHYEYKTAYWDEAKILLDKGDRKIFFLKWSAVAAILLLLSFGGLYQNDQTITEVRTIVNQHENEKVWNNISSIESAKNKSELEKIISDRNEAASNSDQFLSQNSGVVNHVIHENLGNIVNENEANDFEQTLPEEIGSELVGRELETALQNDHLNEVVVPNLMEENEVPRIPETSDNFSAINNSENLASLPLEAVNFNSDLTLNKLNKSAVERLDNNLKTESFFGPEIKIEKFVLKPTHTISLFGNMGLGNKYGEPNLTPSWRTSGGIEYLNRSFGRLRNFELGATLGVGHVRQNNFGTERRVNVFKNDGGTEKFWYKLQLKDMLYANISGIVNYRVTEKHKLKFGIGLDRLIFVQSNMSYRVNPDEGITTVNNNWGVKDGLNEWDIRLSLGYEFQINNRLAFQLNGSYGLLDRTDNHFLSNDFTDHEMNFNLGLKYTLFRKL